MSTLRQPDASPPQASTTIAHLVAALSLAGDLGVGLPLEHCLRACYVGLHVAAELGVDRETREDVFWTSLLKDAGCTSFTTQAASFLQTDEIAARRAITFYRDDTKVTDRLDWLLTEFGTNSPPWTRAAQMLGFFANGRDFVREGVRSATEVAQRIATRLGMPPGVLAALGAVFERWDGRGLPLGLRGETIPIAARIVYTSTYIDVFLQIHGVSAARDVSLQRRGTAFDGAVVDAFLRVAARPGFWEPLASESILEVILARKPSPPATIATSAMLDATSFAFADFGDLKSPYLTGHARRVANLALELGRRRLPAAELSVLHRAALMHDAGYVAVPSFVINQPSGERTAADQEAMRRHPQQAELMLRPVSAFARERTLIANHHMDSDVAHSREIRWDDIPIGARIIGLVDRFDELTHDQPGTPAQARESAVSTLRSVAGREVDGDLVAVLENAVQASVPSARPRNDIPGGLTEREVEIIRLLGKGQNRKTVASSLVISEATVRHHLEHIYAKIGVTTQVGAVLFAMEHGLLDRDGKMG